ncbi:MAG: hypothetical protein GKS01_12940 [Alphaproteobacteria bacterium]|nr:hypothetical protein [Alphaproteobacteria bacterium]
MKRYMLLHFGFEKPTPDIMTAWKNWFESIADITVENGGFHGGAREISHDGSKDITMGAGSITGYSIINAVSLEEAEQIAAQNPFIESIRVYEIVTG